jgi:hypothetical protein
VFEFSQKGLILNIWKIDFIVIDFFSFLFLLNLKWDWKESAPRFIVLTLAWQNETLFKTKIKTEVTKMTWIWTGSFKNCPIYIFLFVPIIVEILTWVLFAFLVEWRPKILKIWQGCFLCKCLPDNYAFQLSTSKTRILKANIMTAHFVRGFFCNRIEKLKTRFAQNRWFAFFSIKLLQPNN